MSSPGIRTSRVDTAGSERSPRCVNVTHEGIADLLAHMSGAGDDKAGFEAAIVTAAEHLAWRVDIDPLLKHDFLLVRDAVEIFRSRHGAFAGSATDRLFRHCFATYQQARALALSAASTFPECHEADTITSYEVLCGLPRSRRLSLQSTLIRRNEADMSAVYDFIVGGVTEDAAVLLNVGDGVAWHSSFLARIVERMQDSETRRHIISIDISPDIYDLQKEVVRNAAGSTCTFAFHQLNVCATWFADGVIDCAVGSFMVDDCRDQPAMLRELRRIVKPDGTICLSGHHLAAGTPADAFVHNFGDLHHLSGHPVTPADVRRMLAAAQLPIQDEVELPHAWGTIVRRPPDTSASARSFQKNSTGTASAPLNDVRTDAE
jgi:SAM-dependent methyltransferase